jgi:SOS response regulatory protein OraA/RecX
MDDRVLQVALKCLNKQTLTVQKLTDKLLRSGFEIDAVAECVDRICRWGYLNDRQLGMDRLKSLQVKLKSRSFIEADLTHSGLESSLVNELLDEYYPEVTEVDIARKLIDRKYNGQKESAVKMGQYLLRAGFSENTVRQCFSAISST